MNKQLKHGYYTVNNRIYYNKIEALQNCRTIDEWPNWHFNDKEYSGCDWTIEPELDLYDIYKNRALQLRETYDNLILYFSGGIDSTVILRTFIDNDILLDGIVVYGAFGLDNFDKNTKYAINQEQYRVAIPYLEEIRTKLNPNINVYFLDTIKYQDRYQNTDWVYSVNCFSSMHYPANFYWEEPYIQEILMTGNTAFIRGIEKPRVIYDNDNWYCAFLDGSVLNHAPTSNLKEKQYWDVTEYFYWTPDMPELVIKQCHIIKNYMKKYIIDYKNICSKNKETFQRKKYNDIIQPLIYNKYVKQEVGKKRPYFSVPQNNGVNFLQAPKQQWFLSKEFKNKHYVKIWRSGLDFINDNVNSIYFNKGIIESGLVGCWSPFYPLE